MKYVAYTTNVQTHRTPLCETGHCSLSFAQLSLSFCGSCPLTFALSDTACIVFSAAIQYFLPQLFGYNLCKLIL